MIRAGSLRIDPATVEAYYYEGLGRLKVVVRGADGKSEHLVIEHSPHVGHWVWSVEAALDSYFGL